MMKIPGTMCILGDLGIQGLYDANKGQTREVTQYTVQLLIKKLHSCLKFVAMVRGSITIESY